jgi:catechol 2,3-dioxygenase-like lactoylglutathione lyase family enzyme
MNITSGLIVLYVSDVAASATFYGGLFGRKPADQSPAFALFVLDGGMKLGLFLQAAVEPRTMMTGGGCELVVMTDSREAVDSIVADWRKRGLVIGQDAVNAPFGYTAVALDPDQHRIRVLFDPQA